MKRWNCKRIVKSIILLLFVIFIFSLIINRASLSHQEREYKTIYVSQGDTLWTIAAELQKEDFYKGKDIRNIIYELKKANSLTSSTLYVNQELLVPIA